MAGERNGDLLATFVFNNKSAWRFMAGEGNDDHTFMVTIHSPLLDQCIVLNGLGLKMRQGKGEDRKISPQIGAIPEFSELNMYLQKKHYLA